MELQCITSGHARLVSDFYFTGNGILRYKPMVATSFHPPKRDDRLSQLWADLLAEAVLPDPGRERSTERSLADNTTHEAELLEPLLLNQNEFVSYRWKKRIEALFHHIFELEHSDSPLSSADEANPEGKAISLMPIEAAHEATLSIASPFRWEPKHAWINSISRSNPVFSNTAHPRLFLARPKIPIRPLHKQPFYKRLIFYLQRWLNSVV